MATWTPRNAMRGIAVSRWGRPPTPPYLLPPECYHPSSDTPTTTTTSSSSTPTTTTPDSDLEDDSPDSPYHPIDSDMMLLNNSSLFSGEREGDGEGPEVDDWLESQLATTGEMSVVERLQYLLDTGQFADVNIRVGQGNDVTVFKAHRLLLATASQPLYRLVYTVNPSPGPNDVTTIRVTDMKAAHFEHILRYIYTDTIDCSNINVAFELLKASKRWGLAGLGIKSLNYLEEFLDDYEPNTEDMKTNLFDLLVLSEQSLNDMYQKCLQVLLKHCNEVIPCEGFLNLEKPTIYKIITHDDLKFCDQLKLFQAIRDWGLRYLNHKDMRISQLGDVVEDLIKVIDFEKIDDNDFVATVLTSECLGKAEVIAFFMTRGLEIPRNLDFNNNKQLPFWLWFCATSDPAAGNEGKGHKQENSNNNSNNNNLSSSSTGQENGPKISLKNEATTSSLLAFRKVCRFRKGYRCPQEEIYLPHELRFRVSKNIKLIGVGFGFLFSCTDMGVTIHCQGPWETRQWTDLIQTYCRVSGEKQETADVRLLFSEPVRIQANHSYKVMVKIGRMSSGSSEVELWGGTGAQYTVNSEEMDFFFIKAAVDPNTKVEEKDGDVSPGIITELLYQVDTDDYSKDEVKTETVARRRRPKPQEEEEEESEEKSSETSPWRKRIRAADMSLQIPEATRIRRRGDGSDSISYTPKKSPIDEYKPMSFSTNRWPTKKRDECETSKTPTEEYKPSSFSTNRWRTRTKDEDSDKTVKADEYKPSSFATNRWRTSRPQEDSTTSFGNKTPDESKTSSYSNRWRTRPQEDSTTGINKAAEEVKPSSFSTNRWRTRSREEDADTSSTFGSRKTSGEEKADSYSSSRWRTRSRDEDSNSKATPDTSALGIRKASAEEKSDNYSSANRWRTRSREEVPPPKVELRKTIGNEDDKSTSSLPFLRKRESAETKTADLPYVRRRESTETKVPEMPAYLRKRSNPVEENKTATPFGRSRWGSSTTTASSGADNDNTRSTTSTTRSRFLPSSSTSASSVTSSQPSDSSYTSRTRDSSSRSRFSTSRDIATPISLSKTRESSLSRNPESSLSRFRDSSSLSRFGTSSIGSYGSSYLNRYDSSAGTSTDTTGVSNKYGSGTGTGSTQRRYVGAGSDSALCRSRYGSSLTNGGTDFGIGSSRYSSATNRGGNNATSTTSSRYGSSGSGLNDSGSSSRYGSSTSIKPSDIGSSSRYGNSASMGSTDTGSSSSSTSRYGRYSSPFSTRGTDSTSKSTASSRYGSSSALSPSSTTYDSTSSNGKQWNAGSKYGNDTGPSSRYGSTSSRYQSSSSSRY